jgi:YVTN family beta-propeller protein
VIAAVALSSGGGGGGESGGSQPRVVGSPIPVEDPIGVTFAAGNLWVANRGAGTVTRVAPDGGDRAEIDVEDGPFGIAGVGDSVWVANSRAGTVSRIDAKSGEVKPPLRARESPYFIAVSETRAFVTNGDDDTVSEWYTESGKLRRAPFATGPDPRGIAIADGSIWVANRGDGTLWRIAHGKTERRWKIGNEPNGVAAGEGGVWVANGGDGTVTRIDIESGETRTVPTGEKPFAIAVGEGYAWVANSDGDSVVRLDTATGERVGKPIRVPGQPVGLAIGDGSVWVTLNDRGAVVRIEP